MSKPRRSDPPDRRIRASTWRPFLTGVAIGLAFLLLAGLAFGQAPDPRPFGLREGAADFVMLGAGPRSSAGLLRRQPLMRPRAALPPPAPRART
jgi:hypothetical protein